MRVISLYEKTRAVMKVARVYRPRKVLHKIARPVGFRIEDQYHLEGKRTTMKLL